MGISIKTNFRDLIIFLISLCINQLYIVIIFKVDDLHLAIFGHLNSIVCLNLNRHRSKPGSIS